MFDQSFERTLSYRLAVAYDCLFIDQIADQNILREAWYRVQRGGKTAGVDGVTVDAFRPYAERRLAELARALMPDTLLPWQLGRDGSSTRGTGCLASDAMRIAPGTHR